MMTFYVLNFTFSIHKVDQKILILLIKLKFWITNHKNNLGNNSLYTKPNLLRNVPFVKSLYLYCTKLDKS